MKPFKPYKVGTLVRHKEFPFNIVDDSWRVFKISGGHFISKRRFVYDATSLDGEAPFSFFHSKIVPLTEEEIVAYQLMR